MLLATDKVMNNNEIYDLPLRISRQILPNLSMLG